MLGISSCILLSDFGELHGNLHDPIVASKQFDISLCSETLASNMRHDLELSIPVFIRPILLKWNEVNRDQGVVGLPLIRSSLNVGAMKFK